MRAAVLMVEPKYRFERSSADPWWAEQRSIGKSCMPAISRYRMAMACMATTGSGNTRNALSPLGFLDMAPPVDRRPDPSVESIDQVGCSPLSMGVGQRGVAGDIHEAEGRHDILIGFRAPWMPNEHRYPSARVRLLARRSASASDRDRPGESIVACSLVNSMQLSGRQAAISCATGR